MHALTNLGSGPGARAIDGACGINQSVIGKRTACNGPILDVEGHLGDTNLTHVRTGAGQFVLVIVGQGGLGDIEFTRVGVDDARVDVLDLVYDEGGDEFGAI